MNQQNLFGGILSLITIFLNVSCQTESPKIASHAEGELKYEVVCDAENVSGWFRKRYTQEGYEFGSGSMQTDSLAHSGKFSCEVNNSAKFGMSITLTKVKKGDYVEISVWRYSPNGKGALHVSSQKKGDIYYLVKIPMLSQKNGWEKISINVPVLEEIDALVVACYNPNEASVYFDDLSIKVYSSRPVYYEKRQALEIHIADSNFEQLEEFRRQALDLGVISKKQKKYIKATLLYHGEEMPVKLRFKGDWTDHLEGDKWSFRIKVGKGHALEGLKTFSIQSPHTRSFLKEWFIHRIFENLGLLNTRYEFIPVVLNGKNLGVFAIEEHFDKSLIEARQRREGPILKYDEEGFWERTQVAKVKGYYTDIPYYSAAAVLPFKANRTMKSESLKSQFLVAQNLMFQYKKKPKWD